MAKRNEGEVIPEYILWVYSSNNEGKHPVKLRITHQRKRKYYSLLQTDRKKLFLSAKDYEKLVSTPLQKLRGENREVRSVMDKAVDNAKQVIEETTNKGKNPFSFSQFEKNYLGEDANRNLLAFFKSHIDKLQKKGQAGTARAYSSAYSAFKSFQNGRDIDPADLTPAKLYEFDEWLRQSYSVIDSATKKQKVIPAKNDTSISIYMRCLRSVYNEMAANDEYLLTVYPFSRTDRDKKYKVPSGSGGQKGQTLSKDEVINFIHGEVSGELTPENPMYRAKQLFLFSFFGQGMNFKDLALLKYENINKGVLEFDRQKTVRTKKETKKIRIPLTDELNAILIEQGNPEKKNGNYVFSLFDPIANISEKEKDDRIRQWIKTTNKWLKRYCALNNLPEVSTYASRHSFASIAKTHLPVVQISKMLGHSRITTTQTYLGRFEDEENKSGLMKVFNDVKKKSA